MLQSPTTPKRGRDYIGVAVGAVIHDGYSRYFMAKRGANVNNEVGKWEFPGGGVEFNETLADAIKREVVEEYGFVVRPTELLGVVDHILKDEKQHWVSPSFLCEVVSGEPRIMEPEKCDEIGWFTLAEIGGMDLSLPTQHDLEKLQAKLKS